MKVWARLAAVSAALSVATAANAAGDYVTIVQELPLAVPAETAWAKVKGYCDIGKFLNPAGVLPCEITQGKDSELGAVRKIAGRIEEVVVAVTPLSYTYADVDPKILYHGTVEIRPVDKKSSKLVYTLFFDQTSVPADQREANKTRRATMFLGVMKAMKAQAEAK
ncbi:SRPBCC family protein [Phenylobacterium sp.]|uniref:SRPBCC family protein n=1 Tax=Phenylobacterium sp. TaxID=1871053 RepID=UPI0025F9C881|nr:SRPBCC family protein [Phenylobacterium sp.]MBX3485003.1 SRPBCC family protein [Phenylobacterium sp.]MCW5759801.1 SRPBCC family protein [Phenylobacterium sp.]